MVTVFPTPSEKDADTDTRARRKSLISNGAKENVIVAIRLRPLLAREVSQEKATRVSQCGTEVFIRERAEDEERMFTFDSVVDDSVSQEKFFDRICRPLIENSFEGFNGTVFAYGQTGSGKTYTMYGNGRLDNPGITYRTADCIESFIQANAKDTEIIVQVSVLEIYQEMLIDLLMPTDSKKGSRTPNSSKLNLREDPIKGVFVSGLSRRDVESSEDIAKILEEGHSRRHIGHTDMNSQSSRSHSIVTITLSQRKKSDKEGLQSKQSYIHLVDLAGSERADSTGATGQRLKEGAKINQSLTALGHVIKHLVEGKKHIPYRNSALTRLLQSSFGGNSKTLMIANISPVLASGSETLSTIRFASRAKLIQNRPTKFLDPKMKRIAELEAEVASLQLQLNETHRAGQKTDCCTIQ